MTDENPNSPKLFRPTTARLCRSLTICILFSCVGLLGVPARAQNSAPPPSSTEAAPSAQQRPDSDIAEDINQRLMASNTLRPLDLGIWVHDGIATLTGTVPTPELRTQAEDMVRSVDGVKTIDDKITIGTPPTTAPGFNNDQHAPEPNPGAPGSGAPNAAGPNDSHPGDANGPPPPPPPPDYDQNQSITQPPAYGDHSQPATVTIAPGTPVYVMVMQTIDSKHTKVGTPLHGVLVQNIVAQNGVIAVPRGADVMGTVIDARGPGHLKGRPQLALQLTGLNVASTTYPMTSYVWSRGGPGKGGQSAANIGGSAAVGAIIGGAVGGGPTALLGGLLGGLGGAGISAASSGPQLMIPAESVVTFYLNAPLTVHVPTEAEIRMLASRVPPAAYGYGRPAYYPGYPPPGYAPPPPYAPPPGPPGGYPY